MLLSIGYLNKSFYLRKPLRRQLKKIRYSSPCVVFRLAVLLKITAVFSESLIFEICNPPHFNQVIVSGLRNITFDGHCSNEQPLIPTIVVAKLTEYSVAAAMPILAAYGIEELLPATEQP